MEMSVKVDFQGAYQSAEQTSTPGMPNSTLSLFPGYPLDQSEVSCDSNGTGEYEAFYLTAQFVTGLVLYPVFCITGILGNSLSLIVLSHRDMATSTNVYLLALGISDTLKLLNDFLYFVMLVISQHNPAAAETMMVNVYPYAHYVFQVALCSTAWLTVAVSMDRYISVCYPSRSKSMCTIPNARTVVTSVFVIMILLSIPSAFRYRLQTVHDTVSNNTCLKLVVTELGRNKEFMIPYTWVQNLLRGIIPVFVLIFLNARIINVLRMERVKGKKFSSRNRITLMLILMVVIFIVCITPDAIMSTFFGKGYVEEDNLVKGLREITDALLALNSSVNFLLYCSLSVLFRKTFTRVFFGKRYSMMEAQNRHMSRDYTTSMHGASGRRRSGKTGGGGGGGKSNWYDDQRRGTLTHGDKNGNHEEEQLIGDRECHALPPPEEEIRYERGNDGQIKIDMDDSPTDSLCQSNRNGECRKLSCDNHECLMMETRPTSLCSDSDNTGVTSAAGARSSSTSSSNNNIKSSGDSSSLENKTKRPNGVSSSLLCVLSNKRQNNTTCRTEDENPAPSADSNRTTRKKKRTVFAQVAAKLSGSKSQSSSNTKPKQNDTVIKPPERRRRDIDLSYLTDSVYLGPTTEVLPFPVSKKREPSSNCSDTTPPLQISSPPSAEQVDENLTPSSLCVEESCNDVTSCTDSVL